MQQKRWQLRKQIPQNSNLVHPEMCKLLLNPGISDDKYWRTWMLRTFHGRLTTWEMLVMIGENFLHGV